MTEAEIAMVTAARVQPTYDREPVDGSSVSDLDAEAVRRAPRRIPSGVVRSPEPIGTTLSMLRRNLAVRAIQDGPLTVFAAVDAAPAGRSRSNS